MGHRLIIRVPELWRWAASVAGDGVPTRTIVKFFSNYRILVPRVGYQLSTINRRQVCMNKMLPPFSIYRANTMYIAGPSLFGKKLFLFLLSFLHLAWCPYAPLLPLPICCLLPHETLSVDDSFGSAVPSGSMEAGSTHLARDKVWLGETTAWPIWACKIVSEISKY